MFFRFRPRRPRRPQDGLAVPLLLQMIPSEMLPINRNEVASGGDVIQGIEFDDVGRRVAYHCHGLWLPPCEQRERDPKQICGDFELWSR